MPTLTSSKDTSPLTLHLEPTVRLDDDQFYEICSRNRDLRIERTATGDLIIMPPAGGKTSDRNSEINMQLRSWARRYRPHAAVEIVEQPASVSGDPELPGFVLEMAEIWNPAW